MKRQDYISWEEYFMGIASLSSMRSKDPSTQVGACIVSLDNKIIGIGYNGFPLGISDDDFPWDNTGEFQDTKYPYVCHAELNAIINSTKDLHGSSIYVTLFPCNECAKVIIQSGIKHIYYLGDKNIETKEAKASIKMFQALGITHKKVNIKLNIDL